MASKKTAQDYHFVAQRINAKWVGKTFPETVMIMTKWECLENGHIWEAPYNRIQQKHKCPHCGGMAKKTDLDYHALALKNSFSWVGSLSNNTHTKTLWRCPYGHEWLATYKSIDTGNGCHSCSGRYRRTPDDYHKLATERGFKWIGELPTYTATVTQWKCDICQYEWKASYRNIFGNGSGCPKCSKVAPLTLEDYLAIGGLRNLEMLEPMPLRNNIAIQWECNKGHVFKRSYSNLQQSNSGCPLCGDFVNGKRVSKPQRILHQLIGGELNYRVGQYAIDIAFPKGMIAVEYDCWFWHNAVKDAKRDKLFIGKGWKIIRVKAGVMIPTLEQFQDAVVIIQSGKQSTEIVLQDYKL